MKFVNMKYVNTCTKLLFNSSVVVLCSLNMKNMKIVNISTRRIMFTKSFYQLALVTTSPGMPHTPNQYYKMCNYEGNQHTLINKYV